MAAWLARTHLAAAALLALAAPALLASAAPARAQGFGLDRGPDVARGGPVTFTADEVEYDERRDTVVARGRVEAWQGERVLRADEFTYNRTTGVATARGNVVLIEPDGQVLFADNAELRGGMREAALEGLRGLLAANGRVAAAGARRTPAPGGEGTITDLARVVYSTCDLCPEDPTQPPLWQVRARVASLHTDEQRVRYRGAALQMWGWPVLWTPYFSHASPDAPRASGFLAPVFGYTRLLGAFIDVPYYWAIDEQSDARISTVLSAGQYPNLDLAYRRRFNSGEISLEGSVGHLRGGETDQEGLGGHIFANGNFALDENWRAGFSLNRASSRDYLRAYRYGAPRVLTSAAYTEGFWGTQGYARLDGRFYQGLSNRDDIGLIPFVLPYGYAEWAFQPDALGGRFTLDAQGYAIFRSRGTDTRRLATRASYELPWVGSAGEVWTLRGQADLLGGWVDGLGLAPTFGDPAGDGFFGRAHARVALDWRLPLIRPAGEWGAQLIEPRVQLVSGPAIGSQLRFPNEDSLDFEFTDANLFELNRFPGRDRLEGGTRADAALRAAWLFPNGGQVEGLVGRSVRFTTDETFAPGSGLEGRSSDWVARARLAPVPWFELLGRTRLDKDSGEPRLWDGVASLSLGPASLTGGYLLTNPQPGFALRKREEVSAGVGLRLNQYWRTGVFGRYDIGRDEPVAASASLTYEDECFIFETRFVRNWARDPGTLEDYSGGTLLLFRLAFKTVGDFGIRAL
jgi:LPS-assembly protein